VQNQPNIIKIEDNLTVIQTINKDCQSDNFFLTGSEMSQVLNMQVVQVPGYGMVY